MQSEQRKSRASTGPPQSALLEPSPDLHDEGEIDDALLEATTWWSAWADYQHDVADFVSNRIAKDQEIVRSVFTVHSFSDMLQVQSRWMTEASQDFSAEAVKFAALSTANVPRLDPALRFPD